MSLSTITLYRMLPFSLPILHGAHTDLERGSDSSVDSLSNMAVTSLNLAASGRVASSGPVSWMGRETKGLKATQQED